uniref:Neuromedin Bb n=1 Tax=Paramormyrops kingsleyae TaxID=1676925 RepID=A0A3B3RC65_9TELE
MTAVTWSGACQFGFLSYLLLVPYISVSTSVSLDLTELRNKVSKIKVNPRGNLWATGHFMGKKSVLDGSPMESPTELKTDEMEDATKTEKLKLRLLQEVLKMAQQIQGKHYYGGPTIFFNITGVALMKILEGFIQNRRK